MDLGGVTGFEEAQEVLDKDVNHDRGSSEGGCRRVLTGLASGRIAHTLDHEPPETTRGAGAGMAGWAKTFTDPGKASRRVAADHAARRRREFQRRG